ncbi:ATG2 [Candida pseudojiufengensis]|uniref:ATG2 n=1 Tax=Candida pseudojiufengensis TaxID=497109 RepID=UPI002224B0C6|nr:ATG2 [Candida pseudojiufengensis]KAI5964670.1 ATG2 [Candida pseudojiufengensis]
MSPQWIPQNIQKRLLLYVLNQLSLFSEVDLPNLEEVSLNNITLKDVTIDPEKCGKIPGFNLRFGKLGVMELSTVSGISGVKIDVKNAEIVISPDFDDENTSQSQFSLARSTADLANTIMLDTDELKNESAIDSDEDLELEETEKEKDMRPNSRRRSSTMSNKSALGNVMQKAVDMALSRLQINITNISIKLITESTDLVFEVEEMNISTINGTRKITAKGTKLKTLRPIVETGDLKTEKSNSNTSNDDVDDGYEENDYGEEELMNSMVFTHEEASSIYMSATSQSFEKPIENNGLLDNKQQNNGNKPPILLYMNQFTVEFEGLQAISNLDIEIDEINFAFTPIAPTLISILSGIAKTLKVKHYQRRRSSKFSKNKNEKFPQYSNEDDSLPESEIFEDNAFNTQPFFNGLSLGILKINSTSAIGLDGSFIVKSGLTINFENIIIKQKNELRLFGGVETITIEDKDSKVFYFETLNEMSNRSVSPSSISSGASVTSKADFRFEVFQKEDSSVETTFLLAKTAYLNLVPESLIEIVNIFKTLSSIYGEFTKFQNILNNTRSFRNDSKKEELKPENHLIFQTASIATNLKLSIDTSLQLRILPIKFASTEGELSIPSIYCNGLIENVPVTNIININRINICLKPQDLRSYIQPPPTNTIGSNEKPKLANVKTKLVVLIDEASFALDSKHLKLIIKELQSIAQKLKDPITSAKKQERQPLGSSSVNLRRGVRVGIGMGNSAVGTTKYNIADYFINLKKVEVKINNILPKFGSIETEFTNIDVFKVRNEILGSVHALQFTRSNKDAFLHHYQNLPSNELKIPLILFRYKGFEELLEVSARDLMLEYYTNWLSLFGKDESIIEQVEEELIDTSPPKAKNSTNRFDIRMTLYNCAIGFLPGRLKCKSYLTISKVNSDFVFTSNQFYIKSSFRDINLLLIDDLKNVLISKSDGDTTVDYLLSKGYIHIGAINIAHLGLTFNTNIEEIKRKNQELGIRDSLSIIDFKINSDELQLDLCPDSFNALVQLINDLKLPYDFEDKDKMEININNEIDVLKDIDDEMFNDLSDAFTEMNLGPDSFSNSETGSTSNSQSSSGINFQDEHFDYTSQIDNEKIDPLKININLTRVKFYMYDGFDWRETRKTIRGVVKKLESKQKLNVNTTNARDHLPMEEEHFDESEPPTIEENLFQSIHVSAPKGSNIDLTKSINFGLQNDEFEEFNEDKVNANIEKGKNYKNLKLKRSMFHKLLFDLKNIDLGVSVYSTRDPRRDKTDPNLKFELLNQIEINLDTLDIYDNVVSSTWNKFLSYMNVLGEREIGTSMLRLNILNVRPKPSLVASEAIIKVSILPLRLHIDQDTLDFMVRFFEFKDKRFELPPDEILYIQKFEINMIKLKIDYKPKKLDYVGLRSGKSAELANIFILDGSKLTLPGVKLFGMSGMPELGQGLGKAWNSVFQSTQVLGLISGVSSLRSIVNIGNGFKDLILISKKEYKKDGRFWRSLQKGTTSLAKTTGYELINIGVKLASGTQVLLEQGEEMFGGEGSSARTNKVVKRRNSDASDDSIPETSNIPSGGMGPNVLLSSEILNRKAMKMKYGQNKESYEGLKYSNILEIDDDYGNSLGLDQEFLKKSIFLLPPTEEDDEDNGDSGDNLKEKSNNNIVKSRSNSANTNSSDEYDIFAINEEDEEEFKEKMISLYSNQPQSIQQGLSSAYKSLGKNFKLTGKQLNKIKNELNDQKTYQDSVVTILKNSPIILIRPMIGTTEAISKTLMGLGNMVDSKNIIENKDKYRSDKDDEK